MPKVQRIAAHKPLVNFFYVAFLEIKKFLYSMDSG